MSEPHRCEECGKRILYGVAGLVDHYAHEHKTKRGKRAVKANAR